MICTWTCVISLRGAPTYLPEDPGFGVNKSKKPMLNWTRKEECMPKGKGKRQIGRDAGDGRFIPVDEARRRKGNAVVETIPASKKKKGK